MLKALRQHPVLVELGAVLADGVRYVAIVLVLLVLFGEVVRLAALGSRWLLWDHAPSRMESYDGAEAIERAWGDGLKPDPLLTVSQWADRYRVLSQRASSEPGRWRMATSLPNSRRAQLPQRIDLRPARAAGTYGFDPAK